MKRMKVSVICLSFLFGIQTVSGQTEGTVGVDPRNPVPDWVNRVEIKRARDRPINGIGKNGMMINREVKARRIPLYKGKPVEISELEKAFERTKSMLVVPQSYYEKYKFLLKDKKVELARLQRDKNCYGNLVVSVEDLEKCMDVVPIPGGGSFYSFRTKFNYPIAKSFATISSEDITRPNSRTVTFPRMGANAGGDWWNIHFTNENLHFANSSVSGIVSEIGDVDLEGLNLKSTEFKFLNDFKPSKTIEEVRGQNEALRKGVKFNNFIYSNSASMKLNSTYVLRSIDYHSSLATKLTAATNKRADMTIAFKIIGLEADGSIIILWKELKAQRLPKKIRVTNPQNLINRSSGKSET